MSEKQQIQFEDGPRDVREILRALDVLSYGKPNSRSAILDAMTELEMLRKLVSSMRCVLPTCQICWGHIAVYKDPEDVEGDGLVFRCVECHASLSGEEQEDFERLAWADLADGIDRFCLDWAARGIHIADTSVVQLSFTFQ